jgi:hypothetical protein
MHGRIPMPDMLMTAFMTASLWMLWRMARGAPRAWIGFYLFVGLAFWAKGPGLPAAHHRGGLGGVRPQRRIVARSGCRSACRCSRSSRTAVFRLFRHAEGLRRRSSNQILVSASGPARRNGGGGHQNAFGILFPWVFLLPFVLVEAVRLLRRRGPERDALLLMIVASVTMFVVIAASQQQRFRYYLPLVPPVSLLIGWWADSVLSRRLALRVPWRVCAAVGALLAAAGVAGAFSRRNALNEVAMVWPAYVAQATVLVATIAAVAAVLSWSARDRRLPRVRGRLGRLRRARRRQPPLGARAPERGVRLRGPAQADGAAPARVAGVATLGLADMPFPPICAGRSCRPARAISARSWATHRPSPSSPRAHIPEDSDGFTVLLRDRPRCGRSWSSRIAAPYQLVPSNRGVTP